MIRHIQKNATSLGTIAVAGASVLRGVALDPADATIWVLDEGQGKLYHVSRTGAAIGTAITLPVVNVHVGLARQRDGTFWVSDQSSAPNGKLWHLSATGATIGSFTVAANVNFRGIAIVDVPPQAVRWLAIGP